MRTDAGVRSGAKAGLQCAVSIVQSGPWTTRDVDHSLAVPMKITVADADVYAEADRLVEALRSKFNLKAPHGG